MRELTPLEMVWRDWNLSHMMNELDGYCQVRKMGQHVSLTIPWEIFETGINIKYSDMMYANETSKVKQLTRNYFNEPELVRMRDLFLERMASPGGKSHQSSISAKLGAEVKKKSSMGFCMQTITMNYLKDGCFSIDMNYRSTETVVKFLADLKYLHEILFPFILEGSPVKPDKVHFTFSVCYFSIEFLGMFFQFADAIETMEELEQRDPKYFRRCSAIMNSHMDPDLTSTYQTRQKVHNLFWRSVISTWSKPYIRKFKTLIARGRKK